jgi:hypothetical protein
LKGIFASQNMEKGMNKAPIELLQIGLDPNQFFYSDSRSWRGVCPQCGGHRRFVLFTDNEFPLWHGYCDECGCKIKAWEKVKRQYDPQRVAALEAERARQESERAEYRKNKLAEFTTAELWAELRDRMTTEHIEWWEAQGVPEDIQRFLSIGFKADKMYYDGEHVEKHSPAYTIPWFGHNFTFETMQYRLCADGITDRYRFEYGLDGGGKHFYMSDPSEPIKDKVIICEGAKKAIVTWMWLAPADYTVIAASSNNTLNPALEATKECGKRYLILDPGSEKRAFTAARENKNLKAVFMPEKVDDLYLAGHIDRDTFSGILRAL